MKRLCLGLGILATLTLALISGDVVSSSERHQTSCQHYTNCLHYIYNLPECTGGATTLYYRHGEGRDDHGHIGAGGDCGIGGGSCTSSIEWNVPDGSDYRALWWRMHDHEGMLNYSAQVFDGSTWTQVASGEITTSGLGCGEGCSRDHGYPEHPPGDQGCPDPMPVPHSIGWFSPEEINPAWEC